jgi:hypothetical protein
MNTHETAATAATADTAVTPKKAKAKATAKKATAKKAAAKKATAKKATAKKAAANKNTDGDWRKAIREPREGTATAKVWSIADKLNETKGGVTRAGVIERAVAVGINPVTAASQYARWYAVRSL